MIDFEITQLDFASAVRQMTKARTSEAGEQVDLTCTRDSVRFVVTGREFSCPAVVQARGMTRFPVDLLARLREVATSFAPRPLRIRVDEGRVRVNSMSISIPGVRPKHLMDRPIDIPGSETRRTALPRGSSGIESPTTIPLRRADTARTSTGATRTSSP